MSRSTCYECGRSLSTVSADAIERARESLGFGAANDRMRSFCSLECRARWRGVDPVLERTKQSRVTAWDRDGIDPDAPDAIAWGVT